MTPKGHFEIHWPLKITWITGPNPRSSPRIGNPTKFLWPSQKTWTLLLYQNGIECWNQFQIKYLGTSSDVKKRKSSKTNVKTLFLECFSSQHSFTIWPLTSATQVAILTFSKLGQCQFKTFLRWILSKARKLIIKKWQKMWASEMLLQQPRRPWFSTVLSP